MESERKKENRRAHTSESKKLRGDHAKEIKEKEKQKIKGSRSEKLKQSKELVRVVPSSEGERGEREGEGLVDVEDERFLPMVFQSPPPSMYFCPIHNGILFDPVIAGRCGHTFCRSFSSSLFLQMPTRKL